MSDVPLAPGEIRGRLETGIFGRRLYYLPEVDSTNRIAKALAQDGERHGAVVITDYQTAGRGRRDRAWASPRMRNLLFSLVLRPERDAAQVLPLTLAFSLAVADLLADRCQGDVRVKWPNDILADGGKLCGILSEGSTSSGRVTFVIVGIGVNVNMRKSEFPHGMAMPGTSCYTIAARDFDRVTLFTDLLLALELAYDRFLRDGFVASLERYQQRCATIGGDVRVGGEWCRAVGVRDSGGLVVRSSGGEEVVLFDGEFESR